jgi:hypothetical protein
MILPPLGSPQLFCGAFFDLRILFLTATPLCLFS